jgi:hypothetical protein
MYNSSEQAKHFWGAQMGNKFLREKGKTQNQSGLRYKVKEMARKISTLAIRYWHFPK